MARKNWCIVVQVSDKWAVHEIGTKTKLTAKVLSTPILARLMQHNRCTIVQKNNLDATIMLLNG